MQVHTSFFCIFCFLYVVCLLFYAIGGFLFSLYGISQSLCFFCLSEMCMRNLGKLVIMFSCQELLDNSDLRNGETDG